MEKFKRKVPAGIRPVPGHVPSTVFNKQRFESDSLIFLYIHIFIKLMLLKPEGVNIFFSVFTYM